MISRYGKARELETMMAAIDWMIDRAPDTAALIVEIFCDSKACASYAVGCCHDNGPCSRPEVDDLAELLDHAFRHVGGGHNGIYVNPGDERKSQHHGWRLVERSAGLIKIEGDLESLMAGAPRPDASPGERWQRKGARRAPKGETTMTKHSIKPTKVKRREFTRTNICAVLLELGLEQLSALPPKQFAATISTKLRVDDDYHRKRYVEWVLEDLVRQRAAV